jgi:hypothetical protein
MSLPARTDTCLATRSGRIVPTPMALQMESATGLGEKSGANKAGLNESGTLYGVPRLRGDCAELLWSSSNGLPRGVQRPAT